MNLFINQSWIYIPFFDLDFISWLLINFIANDLSVWCNFFFHLRMMVFSYAGDYFLCWGLFIKLKVILFFGWFSGDIWNLKVKWFSSVSNTKCLAWSIQINELSTRSLPDKNNLDGSLSPLGPTLCVVLDSIL